MKLTGAVLVFMAMTLSGVTVSSHLKKRKELLEAVLAFLGSLKIEFRYSALPLERIAEKYAKEENYRSLSFLSQCLWVFRYLFCLYDSKESPINTSYPPLMVMN